jgi:hypothetical protein
MAKKKETGMVVVEKSDGIVKVGATISTADILSVSLAKAESKILENLSTMRAKISKVKKTMISDANEFTDTLNKHVHERINKDMHSMIRVLNKLTSRKHKFEVMNVRSEQAEIKLKDNKNAFISTWYFKTSKEEKQLIVKHEKHMAKLEEELNKLSDEYASWLRAKSQLPTLERQYRAELVSQQLQASAEGREILETMTKDLDAALDRIRQ